MKILIVAAVAVAALIPMRAGAGFDGVDEMNRERARQRVIQQRAFDACIAAAKTETRIKECHEILKRKA
jgi:hypothetical protein